MHRNLVNTLAHRPPDFWSSKSFSCRSSHLGPSVTVSYGDGLLVRPPFASFSEESQFVGMEKRPKAKTSADHAQFATPRALLRSLLSQVGVHIADVSHFVRHDSLLDLEARARGTTVYLVDRRFDMLPKLLAEDLCSLVGGQDRLAVSVVWHVDPSGPSIVGRPWFGRTVIHNRHQLSYPQVSIPHSFRQRLLARRVLLVHLADYLICSLQLFRWTLGGCVEAWHRLRCRVGRIFLIGTFHSVARFLFKRPKPV